MPGTSTLRAVLAAACYATTMAAFAPLPARAQTPTANLAPAPNYKQALKFSATNLRPFVYDTAITPSWIGKTDTFWYAYRGSDGVRYEFVDSEKGTKRPLFDRVKLGMMLSEQIQKPVDPALLPLSRVTLNDEGTQLKFVAEGLQFTYDLKDAKLTKVGKATAAPSGPPQSGAGTGFRDQQRQQEQQQQQDQERDDRRQIDQEQDKDKDKDKDKDQQKDDQQQQRRVQGEGTRGGASARTTGDRDRSFAPDKKAYVYARKHNLYYAEADSDAPAIPLTTDGVADYSFGGGDEDRRARPFVTWSPDSKAFTITRRDSRGIKELYLVNALATPRPTLEKYKYSMPGEEGIRKSEFWIFQRDTKKLLRVPPKWNEESYSDVRWGKTADELRFLRQDRTLRKVELCNWNMKTGEAKCLIPEAFENTAVVTQSVRELEESGDLIWWSERSGWGHFYLYGRDGVLKNPITSGSYRAASIVAVDEKARQLYFNGNGRESGENPNYTHLYRVNLDGTGLALLDPGAANHRSVLSPSRKFLVDNRSRVDEVPSSVLRRADGSEVMPLEQADLSRLTEAGWKMPETFVVKAADGVTDLYGNLWKPFDFDPGRKYPIIVHVYPGPQMEGTTHTFSAVAGEQALAQLGFIVVQVGHRGGTPTRSKAYASYGYFNLRDYALADKKVAVEQLAARYHSIDIDRVGIYGHSGGGFMSAAAMLQTPYNEFFKVAVASSGNHDNNVYNASWSERYHGLREVPTSDDKAAQGGSGQTRGAGTSRRNPVEDMIDGSAALDLDGDGFDDIDPEYGVDPTLGLDFDPQQDQEKGKEQEQDKGAQKDKENEKDKDKAKATKFEIKVPTNAELAANLKGRLLLVHGDMDNNVHPAGTMRLVDALIKANKRFDLLMIPGKRHGYAEAQPYFTQRMWEYFAQYLLGDTQPGADLLQKDTPGGRR